MKIAIILSIIIALIIGICVGIYFSNPVMTSMVNSQTTQINDLNGKLKTCQEDNAFYADKMDNLNRTVTESQSCYNKFMKDVNPITLRRFRNCMEMVR